MKPHLSHYLVILVFRLFEISRSAYYSCLKTSTQATSHK